MHVVQKFGWNKGSLVGLVLYECIGGITFLFDIAILYLLIRLDHAYYPIAIAISFFCAGLLNYLLTRASVFSNTRSSHFHAILFFFIIGMTSLLMTVAGTVFFVQVLKTDLYIGRILVGFIVGVTGYVANSLVTFRMR